MGRRLTNEPRKLGIAQNEQRRSQPLASLSGAIGPPSSRRRTARGPGRALHRGRSGAVVGPDGAARRPGEIGSSRRRSCGVCGVVRLPRQDRAQPGGDVGVVVEAEHGVGLGQRLGEVLAVALGQAADRDDGLGARRSALRSAASSSVSTESFLAASTKPQVFTTTVSASAGVVDQPEAVGLEPAGELLGVDLVAGAAEGHQGDRQRGRASVSGGVSRHGLSSMPAGAPGREPPGLAPGRAATDPVTADRRQSAVNVSCAGWPVSPSAPRSSPSTVRLERPVGRTDPHRRRRP